MAPATTENTLDLDKLAYAVAVAETSNCTAGIALTYNNCHGILKADHTPVAYASTQESFAAFKDLWSRLYVGYPDWDLAYRYTGGDDTQIWLDNVTRIYNQ